jgi:hypothetical protein
VLLKLVTALEFGSHKLKVLAGETEKALSELADAFDEACKALKAGQQS